MNQLSQESASLGMEPEEQLLHEEEGGSGGSSSEEDPFLNAARHRPRSSFKRALPVPRDLEEKHEAINNLFGFMPFANHVTKPAVKKESLHLPESTPKKTETGKQ